MEEINDNIKVIENYPRDNIYFRDIRPLLVCPRTFKLTIDKMCDLIKHLKIDYIAGMESNGYIFGSMLSQKLKCGFIMLQKQHLEKDVLTIDKSLITSNKNILIVDDVLSSGGSILSACDLIEKVDCNVIGCLCLIELYGNNKAIGINKYDIYSLLKYPANSSEKSIIISKKYNFLKYKNWFFGIIALLFIFSCFYKMKNSKSFLSSLKNFIDSTK